MIHRISSILAFIFCALTLTAAETGSISGVVSNQATGALLQDAIVEIPILNRTLLTDQLGRFFLRDLPMGSYTIVVSYTDLDTVSQNVTLTEASPNASLDIPLTSQVYVLDTFTVSSEREGTAAALTRQRTSDNVKNVLSMDAMGILSNENPAELLARIAGVAGVSDEAGDMVTVNIRGMDASMNSVTYDGVKMASSYGTDSRALSFLNINASTFEELEVIKALTPNIAADSLGGTVNMKTKSTLNMKGNFQVNYRFDLRFFPSFFDYNPRRTDHPLGYTASADYRQIFSIGKGHRNLGVAINLLRNEKPTSVAQTTSDYYIPRFSDPATTPTPFDTLRIQDTVSTQFKDSATLRLDYKLSERSRFFLTSMYTQQRDWSKAGMEGINISIRGTQTGTAGNETVSQINTTREFSVKQGYIGYFTSRYNLQFGGEHLLNKLSINYDLGYSRSDSELDGNKGDHIAGWRTIHDFWSVQGILDRSVNSDFPTFTQTNGNDPTKDITKIANAKNPRGQHRTGTRKGENYEAKLDAKSQLSILGTPVEISGGLNFRSQFLSNKTQQDTHRYIGSPPLSDFQRDIELDPRFGSSINSIPLLDISKFISDLYDNPANWNKTHFDYYDDWFQNAQYSRELEEDIYAVYLMGKAKFGKLSMLAGVRFEHTESSAKGRVRKAYRNSYDTSLGDPAAIAKERFDFEFPDPPEKFTNRYHDFFPSIHFTYSFTKNLLARASFSTATGRPQSSELIPGITINTDEDLIQISNTELSPQYALNYDLSLEYYMKSASSLSIGVFRKEISDFIYLSAGERVRPDTYPELTEWTGYRLKKMYNGEKAVINGLEISYNQLLSFLPAPLKTTRVILSYTLLGTSGDYGANTNSSASKDVVGFVPQTFSAQLRYSYKRFGINFSALWTDEYLVEYSAINNRGRYRESRFTVGMNTWWRFSDYLTLNVVLGNIFDEPTVEYVGNKSRRYRTAYNGQFFSVGISGRF